MPHADVRNNNVRRLPPREKRLLIVVFLLALVTIFPPWLLRNRQFENLKAVRDHISQIEPRWRDFQHQNAGFDDVQLFDYTGGDGMFGAYGRVPSDQHLAKLEKFMTSTEPPRPVYVGAVQVLDQETIELLKKLNNSEPDGAANGSQPIRAKTSSTSSSAGSRR